MNNPISGKDRNVGVFQALKLKDQTGKLFIADLLFIS